MTVHSARRAVDIYLRNGFSQHHQLLIRERPLLLWEAAAP